MPGERDLLEEYLTTVDLRLRPLVRTVWEKMQLAGEAGSLLKIEEEIRDALRAARVEAMVDTPPAQMRLDGSHPPRQTSMTLAGTDDIAFWDRAEAKLLDALRDYVRRASNGKATQRRLFAEDAAQGLAFIDVCRKAFDVVLMNPPFGEGATEARHYLLIHYPDTRYDLFSVFVERGLAIGLKGSLTGVISSRNGFFLPSFRRWREEVVLGGTNLRVAADLGQGILDAAMVETASYVLEKR
jgi:hypothetical protein